MSMMEVKEAKAYNVIRQLNKELEAMDKIIISGRINKSYFHLRTDVGVEAMKGR